MIQGYPSIIERKTQQEEEEEDEDEEEEDEAVSLSPSLEQNSVVYLRDGSGGKSPPGPPSQRSKNTGPSFTRSRAKMKIQQMSLTTLDPSNLSLR